MPKNHREPKPVDPEPDSSEVESETDDSSAEEGEETPIPETQKPVVDHDDDDSGTEGSDSESGESDEETELSPIKPKPITIVPPPANSQKSTAKPTANKAEPVTPAKRQAEEKDEGKGPSKRNKKKKPDPEAVSEPKDTANKSKGAEDTPTKAKISESVGAGAESPKKLFQRIWSEDDEIVILQGMLDYEAEKKVIPRADFDAFLEFIKGNLHVDVNKTQVQDKLRRLKTKYDNHRSKDRNKLIPSLSKKPHELAVFELSEKVWGHETLTPSAPAAAKAKSNGPAAKANGTSDKKWVVYKDEDDSDAMCVDAVKPVAPVYGYGFTEEDKILRRGYELFGGRDNSEGAKEWKKLLKEDMELTMKKFDLKRAQMQLVLDNWED